MGSSGLRHRLYKPAQAESSSIQSFDNAVSAASAGKAASECVNSRWPILPMWYGRLDVSCLPARSPAPLRRAGDKERTGCKDSDVFVVSGRYADDCAPRAQRAEEGPMCVTA